MTPLFWAAACAVMTAALLVAEARDSASLRWVFKPAASACFIALAISAGALDSTFGKTILLGLALCVAGDVLLIPTHRAAFLAGMAAFALGHIAYAGAFVTGGVKIGAAALTSALIMAVFTGAVLTRLWAKLDDFRLPVAAYTLIISLMVVASYAHLQAAPTMQALYLSFAAVGFSLSDVSVAEDRFATPSFANRLWGLPLYYAAQCLFAANV
ncbi:MAG: lysoplasmalogenase [Parvularculaceae bacterium]